MNGMHDMGGMDGFGPIRPAVGETPFEYRWEAKAFAHLLACGALGRWNNDAVRSRFESFGASDYLALRYFERWNIGLIRLLIDTGLVTKEEIATGRADPTMRKDATSLQAQAVPAFVAAGDPYRRAASREPAFAEGDRVRARNDHPKTHTRLPRYVRGKVGVVDRLHGVFVFPDTNVRMLGEHPQDLYSVRFDGTELWGDRGDAHAPVYIDIWEQHLELE